MGRWLERAVVLGLLLISLCTGIGNVQFHRDESQWIATSGQFEALVKLQLGSPIWRQQYWTLTQPPLARYAIAVGRLVGGYRVRSLNSPWDFSLDEASNIAAGNMPSPGLLWWSRLPMALLAVASAYLLFGLVKASAGRLAGYVFLLLFVANPYLRTTLGRAMGEASLLFCITLAAWAGAQALTSWRRASAGSYQGARSLLGPFAWLILVGASSGAAGAAKLNGLSMALAGVALCALVALSPAGSVPRRTRRLFATLAALALLLAAALAFVLPNPFLYPDPLGRAMKMLDHRLWEMGQQQAVWKQNQIRGLRMHLTVVPWRIFQNLASMRFWGAWAINLGLCIAGLGYLGWCTWRWLCGRSPASGVQAALLVAALAASAPALFTPLDWNRYYLLPVVLGTAFIAIGLAKGLTACRARWLSRRQGKDGEWSEREP